MSVVGTHYPIGRLPYPIFSVLKTKRFIQVYEKYIEDNGKPSIIHIHFPSILLTESILEYLDATGIPIVVTKHFTKVLRKALNQREKALLCKVVEKCRQYICVSDDLKKSVVDITMTKKPIMVLPNIVSLDKLNVTEQIVKSERFTFIVVGRLVKTKQVEQIVCALSELIQEKMDVRLVVVGDGPRYRSITRNIKRHSLEGLVVMKGMLTHDCAMSEIQKADAYVSASVVETFGVPFIEAMACGKPIIAADNSPVRLYIDASNGLVFKKTVFLIWRGLWGRCIKIKRTMMQKGSVSLQLSISVQT